MNKLVLASASPRRSALLADAGYQFKIVPGNIDESPYQHELPNSYVDRMAFEKALKVSNECSASQIVIASDTSIILDSCILGKPENYDNFNEMMQRMSGKTHRVRTSVVIKEGAKTERFASDSKVTFVQINTNEMRSYWDTGEPCDKAGGYAIQGMGAKFIKRLEGSYTGVIGLPMAEVVECLSEVFNYPPLILPPSLSRN